jgi:hypothetical protein
MIIDNDDDSSTFLYFSSLLAFFFSIDRSGLAFLSDAGCTGGTTGVDVVLPIVVRDMIPLLYVLITGLQNAQRHCYCLSTSTK